MTNHSLLRKGKDDYKIVYLIVRRYKVHNKPDYYQPEDSVHSVWDNETEAFKTVISLNKMIGHSCPISEEYQHFYDDVDPSDFLYGNLLNLGSTVFRPTKYVVRKYPIWTKLQAFKASLLEDEIEINRY